MQLKIRAWDEEKKRYYRDLHKYQTGYIAVVINEENELCLITGDGVYLQPLLFTGIKDRNGQEVYEGDIVEYQGRIFQIIFGATEFNTRAQIETEFVMRDISTTWRLSKDVEVIGNRFEHPELLEQKG